MKLGPAALNGFECYTCGHLSEQHASYIGDCSECSCGFFFPLKGDGGRIKIVLDNHLAAIRRMGKARLN